MRHGSNPSEVCKADPRATPLSPEQRRGARCVARTIVRRIHRRPPITGTCNQPAQWSISGDYHCTKCASVKLKGPAR